MDGIMMTNDDHGHHGWYLLINLLLKTNGLECDISISRPRVGIWVKRRSVATHRHPPPLPTGQRHHTRERNVIGGDGGAVDEWAAALLQAARQLGVHGAQLRLHLAPQPLRRGVVVEIEGAQ